MLTSNRRTEAKLFRSNQKKSGEAAAPSDNMITAVFMHIMKQLWVNDLTSYSYCIMLPCSE